MKRLVGLIGKKRSGKDTVASILVENRGFVRYAFADPLKQAALRLDPFIGRPVLPKDLSPSQDVRLSEAVEELGWERAKEIPEVRRILQEYGIAIREVDEDFWVNATLVPAIRTRETSPVVVTDVRFWNEAHMVKMLGGIIIRVTRSGLSDDDTHISENALNDYEADFTVANDGTLEDLEAAVLSLTV